MGARGRFIKNIFAGAVILSCLHRRSSALVPSLDKLTSKLERLALAFDHLSTLLERDCLRGYILVFIVLGCLLLNGRFKLLDLSANFDLGRLFVEALKHLLELIQVKSRRFILHGLLLLTGLLAAGLGLSRHLKLC